MERRNYKYLYGPVGSWRIGASLGIDPIAGMVKTCSFDCIYCQIGKTRHLTDVRKEYVAVKDVIDEIRSLPEIQVEYITFAGCGEPTLASNLGEMIAAVRAVRKEKIAVITNSSMMHVKEVRDVLRTVDLVMVKLDAPDQRTLEQVNKPVPGITIESILNGLRSFRSVYAGKLAVQIMIVRENKESAAALAAIVNTIRPDEVEINTPLRPCAVAPLSREEIAAICKVFADECGFYGIVVRSVYEAKDSQHVMPISSAETIRRRGKPV